MLRKTMIVLATAAALSAGLTADAFARGGGGGGGGHGGGFGGPHIGGGAHLGSFGAGHLGGTRGAFAPGVAGRHFAQARGRFDHDRHFRHGRRFVHGFGFDDYDYGCSYGYPLLQFLQLLSAFLY